MGREDSEDDSSDRDSMRSSSPEVRQPAPVSSTRRRIAAVVNEVEVKQQGGAGGAGGGGGSSATWHSLQLPIPLTEQPGGGGGGFFPQGSGGDANENDSAGSTDTVELDEVQEQVIAKHGSRGNSVSSSRASSVTRYSGGSDTSGDERQQTSHSLNARRQRAGQNLLHAISLGGVAGTLEVESSLAPVNPSLRQAGAGKAVREGRLVKEGAARRSLNVSADSEDSNPEASESDAHVTQASNPAGEGYLRTPIPTAGASVREHREEGARVVGQEPLAYESPCDVSSSGEEEAVQCQGLEADVFGDAIAAAGLAATLALEAAGDR